MNVLIHLQREQLLASPVSTVDPSVAAQEQKEIRAPDNGVLCAHLNNSETLKQLPQLLQHLSEDKRAELIHLIKEFPKSDSCFIVFFRKNLSTLIQKWSTSLTMDWLNPLHQLGLRHVFLLTSQMVHFDSAQTIENSMLSQSLTVFHLPRIEDCVDQVGSARFVSKFDLLKGYWQVPLTDWAREVSSFITSQGLFSYKVMSFGLRNAPVPFQRLMNTVVAVLEGCVVYLDDVVVYSNSWGAHLDIIRALFHCLSDAHLTINLIKCEFVRATVTYLGKMMGQGQVRPIRAKTLAIERYPSLTGKKELMHFYRSFCRNFSSVVVPLTDLLKSSARFNWTPLCQSAFESVKAPLTSSPI